jgi:hypothetical protein
MSSYHSFVKKKQLLHFHALFHMFFFGQGLRAIYLVELSSEIVESMPRCGPIKTPSKIRGEVQGCGVH